MAQITTVSIIGADSTGKTQLAKSLAEYYGTIWVPEFAREFLIANGGTCQLEDMIIIGRSQVAAEKKLLPDATRVIFSDGSPLASCVWSQRYFGTVTPDLTELAQSHEYDLYLLTDIDLPWREDGLRDSSHLRSWLHEQFALRLHDLGCRFSLVKGKGNDRLCCAVEAVDRILIDKASE